LIITRHAHGDEHAGRKVIDAAKTATYKPAIALLTAFSAGGFGVGRRPGADKMLVKPMHTRVLLQQLEALFVRQPWAVERVRLLFQRLAAKKGPVAKTAATGQDAGKEVCSQTALQP